MSWSDQRALAEIFEMLFDLTLSRLNPVRVALEVSLR